MRLESSDNQDAETTWFRNHNIAHRWIRHNIWFFPFVLLIFFFHLQEVFVSFKYVGGIMLWSNHSENSPVVPSSAWITWSGFRRVLLLPSPHVPSSPWPFFLSPSFLTFFLSASLFPSRSDRIELNVPHDWQLLTQLEKMQTCKHFRGMVGIPGQETWWFCSHLIVIIFTLTEGGKHYETQGLEDCTEKTAYYFLHLFCRLHWLVFLNCVVGTEHKVGSVSKPVLKVDMQGGTTCFGNQCGLQYSCLENPMGGGAW